jgi:hypothetical protein
MTNLPILGGLAVLGFYGHFRAPCWRSWGPGRHSVPRPPSTPSETLIKRQDRHSAMCRRIGDLGRPVVAITADTASIRHPTGNITVFSKSNRPALAPLGDSVDDLDWPA